MHVKLHAGVFSLQPSGLTDDLHREEQTGAPGHVGDHTAVMATVFRPDFLYLQVLTACQPLDATAQLMVRSNTELESQAF